MCNEIHSADKQFHTVGPPDTENELSAKRLYVRGTTTTYGSWRNADRSRSSEQTWQILRRCTVENTIY